MASLPDNAVLKMVGGKPWTVADQRRQDALHSERMKKRAAFRAEQDAMAQNRAAYAAQPAAATMTSPTLDRAELWKKAMAKAKPEAPPATSASTPKARGSDLMRKAMQKASANGSRAEIPGLGDRDPGERFY